MHSHEQGQVLPLGLVLVAFGMAGALMLFNTGQMTTDKMRLANSADAAAYSGALWQARALNYQAYANRAMVANQVAIGQAVSLQSWMIYAKVTSEHIATALKPVPLLNVVTGGIEAGVALAEPVVSLGAQAMLTASNAATKALSASQDIMHAATLVNTAEIIDTVATESDQRFTTNSTYGISTKAANAAQWLAFNNRYTKKDKAAMKERQSLIMDSRDEFTRDRNWDLFDFWVFTTPLSWHKLKKQGTTKLTAVEKSTGLEWEWVAKDTLSVHNRVIGWFKKKNYEFPVSWASAFVNSRGTTKPMVRQSCGLAAGIGFDPFGNRGPVRKCTRYSDNHLAEEFADTNVRSVKSGSRTLKPMKAYGGVRTFWVLSDHARSADDARLTVRVEVSLPNTTVRDAATIIKSSGISNSVVTAGSTLSSISAASVFYQRPQHHLLGAKKREKANAYNPYWQAQLAPVTNQQRLMAVGVRRGGGKPKSRMRALDKASVLGVYREK